MFYPQDLYKIGVIRTVPVAMVEIGIILDREFIVDFLSMFFYNIGRSYKVIKNEHSLKMGWHVGNHKKYFLSDI